MTQTAQSPELTVEELEALEAEYGSKELWIGPRPTVKFSVILAAARKGIERGKVPMLYCPECGATSSDTLQSEPSPLPASEDTECHPYLGESYNYCQACNGRIVDGEGHRDGCPNTPLPAEPSGEPNLTRTLKHILDEPSPASSGEGDVDKLIAEIEETAAYELACKRFALHEKLTRFAEALKRLRDERNLQIKVGDHAWDRFKKAQAERDAMAVQVERLTEEVSGAAEHFDRIAQEARKWMKVCARNEIAEARWSKIKNHAAHRANIARAALNQSKPTTRASTGET